MSWKEALQQAMKDQGLTGNALSKRCGFGHNWISNMISGRRWPRKEDSDKIGEVLGVDLSPHWKPAPWINGPKARSIFSVANAKSVSLARRRASEG